MNDTEPKDDVTTKPEVTISDDVLIIVPVRNLVLFPGTVVPVAINRERSLAAAQEAVRAERKICFVLQHDTALPARTARALRCCVVHSVRARAAPPGADRAGGGRSRASGAISRVRAGRIPSSY